MTQLDLFTPANIAGRHVERPTVGRITQLIAMPDILSGAPVAPIGSGEYGKRMQLPDMRGQPPAVAVETSIAAADAIREFAATLRWKVLVYIEHCGMEGATDQEIQVALDMSGNTERPRRRELEAAKQIIRTERTRKTNAGRMAMVWVAA